ncbi:hypothetical protein SAMN05421847_2504 [Halpernia humi]|uniref:Uncharacterized protein n=1 Tax=Halpernia humi TaxID=493375 RepID=A0A1H6AP91_9FLAO|nr:hypothetical protein [Halpernia humi]SEG49586.1 hypothetical protein SAMN05421847_2504 [Halpernia humi]
MKITFKIEYKYENGYVLARLLNLKENIELKVNAKLETFNIKNIAPSNALNTGNKQRTDLFVFCLKNKATLEKLTVGKIVELV